MNAEAITAHLPFVVRECAQPPQHPLMRLATFFATFGDSPSRAKKARDAVTEMLATEWDQHHNFKQIPKLIKSAPDITKQAALIYFFYSYGKGWGREDFGLRTVANEIYQNNSNPETAQEFFELLSTFNKETYLENGALIFPITPVDLELQVEELSPKESAELDRNVAIFIDQSIHFPLTAGTRYINLQRIG